MFVVAYWPIPCNKSKALQKQGTVPKERFHYNYKLKTQIQDLKCFFTVFTQKPIFLFVAETEGRTFTMYVLHSNSVEISSSLFT